MKLRVHAIVGRKYYRAGEEIPDADVPPAIAKHYAEVDSRGLPAPAQAPPKLAMHARERTAKRKKGSKR